MDKINFAEIIYARRRIHNSSLFEEIKDYCDELCITYNEIIPYIKGAMKKDLEEELKRVKLLKNE